MELEAMVSALERAIVRCSAWEEPGLVRVVPTPEEGQGTLALEVPGIDVDHRIGKIRPVDGRFNVFWEQHAIYLVMGQGRPREAARAVLGIAHAWRQALRLRSGGR